MPRRRNANEIGGVDWEAFNPFHDGLSLPDVFGSREFFEPFNPMNQRDPRLPKEVVPSPTRKDTSRGTPILRPPSNVMGALLDPEALADLDALRLRGELDLAEYAQRVAAANADAEFQRSNYRRGIGIEQAYQPLATGMTNELYNALEGSLQYMQPILQQDWTQGTQAVQDAYNTGQQSLQAESFNGQDLAAQLDQLVAGGGQEVSSQVVDPTQEMLAQLLSGGQQATQGMQTRGSGEVAAFSNMLPGFREEQAETVSDLQLESDAIISELRNELSRVHPDFIPFNLGALQLAQQDAQRGVIEDALARRDEEQDYDGYRGAQDLASAYGRPDLFQEFDTILNTINSQPDELVDPRTGNMLPLDAAIQRRINDYMNPTLNRGQNADSRQILQQILNAYMGNY